MFNDQIVLLSVVGVLLLVGLCLYPAAMFRLLGGLLRGVFNLLADCVALLFAWI